MKFDRRAFLKLGTASTLLYRFPRLSLADDTLNLDSLKRKSESLESKILEAQKDEIKKAYKDITQDPEKQESYEVLSHVINNNTVAKAFAWGENATEAVTRLMSDPLFHARSAGIQDGNTVLAIFRSDYDLYQRNSNHEIDLGDRLEYVERRLRASNDLMDAVSGYLTDLETNRERFKVTDEDLALARKYALTRDDTLRDQLINRVKERISNSEEYQRYIGKVKGKKEDILTNMGIKERIASERRLTSRELAVSHENRGHGFLLNGNYQEAITEFQKSIAADPTFDDPYCNIVAALSKLRRFREGLPYAQTYLRIGDNPEALKKIKEYIVACEKANIK